MTPSRSAMLLLLTLLLPAWAWAQTGTLRGRVISQAGRVPLAGVNLRLEGAGRGTLSDLQQPRWGTQIWDIIFPF